MKNDSIKRLQFELELNKNVPIKTTSSLENSRTIRQTDIFSVKAPTIHQRRE
jgi:hypothetical protein